MIESSVLGRIENHGANLASGGAVAPLVLVAGGVFFVEALDDGPQLLFFLLAQAFGNLARVVDAELFDGGQRRDDVTNLGG